MADIFDTTDQKNEWVGKYKSIKATTERVVQLIKTLKETAVGVKAEIQASTMFDADDKTEMTAKINTRIAESKTAIETEIG